MLKRLDSVERLDWAIAETEIAIMERVLNIAQAEARGRGTKTSRSVLRTLYGLLVEYRRSRDAMVEARDLTGRSGQG